ncbi:hypothetical protein T439DRAFT_42353 [Meredithblackwellia eburnea MCA 4105]
MQDGTSTGIPIKISSSSSTTIINPVPTTTFLNSVQLTSEEPAQTTSAHANYALSGDFVPPPASSDSILESTSNASTAANQKRSISHDYPPPPTYPEFTPILHQSPIQILSSPSKGRGVYSTTTLPAGTLIDISPVLLLSDSEYYGVGSQPGQGNGVEGSVLRGYVFTWKGREGGMALALGVGSLFNHSQSPNVSFELDTTGYVIRYRTFKKVEEGEELCIFYGHRTRFEGDGERERAEDSEEEEGGGLMSALNIVEHGEKKEKRKWDEDIVLFKDLEWEKVTEKIDPEDQRLTLMDCFAIDVKAKDSSLAFAFGKKNFKSKTALSHLKTVKRVNSDIDGRSNSPDSLISVLLCPISPTTPSLSDLNASLQSSPLANFDPVPQIYVVQVPATVARTEKQAEEWGKVWPVTMVHIREGPKALPRAKGWERCKKAWIKKEAEKVWKAAKEAEKRGEHPIACHVTESFDPLVHSPNSLPSTLVRSTDTRKSTNNILSHAASNAIDAVAALDVQGLREQDGQPAPYLLTGLSVFMTHEPCLLCAMSLLHSRIANLFYVRRSEGSGGCGSLYTVHEDEGLNHKFEVWKWREELVKEGTGGVGDGLVVELDP